MRKRGWILLLVLMMTLLLDGCWNRRELNQIGIVVATAVDKGEDNLWEISYQLVIPQAIVSQDGGQSNQTPVTVFSSKGKTLEDAIVNANLETPRSLFFGNNRIAIISEKVAREGVSQLADFYLRSNERRETVDVLLTRENAKKVLEVMVPPERIPGNAMDQIVEVGESNLSLVKKTKMHEFIAAIANPSESPLLPEIKINGDQEAQTSLDALKKTRKRAAIKVGEIGVFKRDKLTGWFNREESIGLTWLRNEIRNTIVLFPTGGTDGSDSLSSFVVESGSSKLKPELVNGKLHMIAEIEAGGMLVETTDRSNLKIPVTLDKFEELIEQQIKKQAETAFQKAVKLGADPFGFGDAFHKKYPRQWKKWEGNWEEAFRDIDMTVHVRANIRRTGMINDSFSKMIKK